MKKVMLHCLVMVVMLSWVINAQAASGDWNVDAAGNWSATGNWNPAVVPGLLAGDTVGLTFNLTAARTITMDTTSRTMGTLNIGDSGSSYFDYTLAASGGATLTFNNNGSTANLVQTTTTGSDTISLPIVLSDDLNVSNTSALTLSGIISGNKSITKVGAGILFLSGANTYTNGTIVNGSSILELNADSGLGAVPSSPTTNITLNGGELFSYASGVTLNANRTISLGASGGYFRPGYSQNLRINGKITGSGGITVVWESGGAILANSANDYTGDTTIGGSGPGSYASTALLRIAVANALPYGTGKGNLVFASTGTDTLDLAGFSAQINGLSGGSASATVDNNTGGGTPTLTVGNNNASGSFAGAIRNTTGTLTLTKVGTGTLTLSGANTYRGTTTVSQGTLAFAGTLNGGGAIAVSDGAALSVRANGATSIITNAASLTLGTSGNTTLAFSNCVGNTTASIYVTNLTANGTVTVNVSGVPAAVGQYPLIKYSGTLNAFSAFALGTLSHGVTASLVNNTANNSIDLNVTAISPVIWRGAVSGAWDINATSNWVLSGSPLTYAEGDIVLLDDSASGTTAVTIGTAVNPSSVTFSNTSKTYSLGGSTGIAGSTSLVKNGTNMLTISVNQPMTGGMTVNDGKLRVTAGNFGGGFTPSLITINTNGTLLVDNFHALGQGTSVAINRGAWLLNYEDYKINVTMTDGLIGTGGGGNGGELRWGPSGGSGTSTLLVTNSITGSVINRPMNMPGSTGKLFISAGRGAAASDLTVSGIIYNVGSIIKDGNGIVTFTATNTYSGTTTVSNGTLIINGTLSTNTTTVATGGTLMGAGTINGPVTIQSGATLRPGTNATQTASLTINNTLNLAGTTLLALNRANAQNSSRVVGITTATYGGTLTVTNVGSALVAGDTFTLFSATSYNGTFATTNLPSLSAGLAWNTSQLAVNGTLTVGQVPSVTTQPVSQRINLSAGVTFTVAASGSSPFAYQWRRNGGNLSGATVSSFNIASVQDSDAGNYSAVVTNAFGSATSSNAVLTVNHAPSFTAISDQTVNEQTTMTLPTSVSDADGGTISYALLAGPSGASVNSSGVISWTPTEAQGPSTNTFTVQASDDGSPAMTDGKTFSVVVNEVNVAPILMVPGTKTLNELTTLTVTNTASDVDVPANTLTFALVSPPSGMTIGASNGIISWTPTEAQGPSTNTVTVSVTDNGSPNLSVTNSFTVIVDQVNNAPIFTLTTNVLTVLEDAGPQSLTIASVIDAGASDEGSQSLAITVTNNNNGLFSQQPSITNGVLSYCVASNANGNAIVTISVVDDGGTLNGGIDTTTTNFTINVLPVNDVPYFTKGSDVSLAPVKRTVAITNWATCIRSGPTNEAAQHVTFIVTNDSSSSFAQQPTISSNGLLNFEIAAGVSNLLATVSVQLTDDGGTTHGGVDSSGIQTFRISLSALFEQSTNYLAGQGPAGIWLGNLRGLTFPGATQMGGPRFRDMIVANYLDNSVTVRFCNDDGTFTGATNYAVGASPFGVISGDFDRDGFEDIVVANSGTNTVSVLMNGTDRTFASAEDYVVGSTPNPGPMGLVPVDLDADGRLDLVIANYNESTVTVLKGLGNGVFSSPTNYAVGQGPMMVWTGDFNGDGKMDVITPDKDAGTLTILPGNGDGTFGTAQTITLFSGGNPQPVYVMPADLNGDGRLDIVTANYNSNTVSILIGQRDGSFQNTTNYNVGANPRSLLLRDLNYDGRVDIAVANSGSDSVSILLSEGSGTFHSPEEVSVGRTPLMIVGSNFNNDDSTDIAVTDYADNGVTTFIYSAPVAYNFGFTVYEDMPTVVPLRSAMTGGALLSYDLASSAAHGVVTNVGTNFVYTPATNYFGSDSFTYTARYESNGVTIVSASATVTLTVAPVNDAPSFNLSTTEVVLVGNGPTQTNLNFATDITAGPNEAAQTFSFVLSTTNLGFFSIQPQMSSSGALTFRTAPGAIGTNTVTIRLLDNGGYVRGTNQSGPQTFKVVVTSAPPVITLQPSIYSVIAGNTVLFQTTASSTSPLSYQWAKNGFSISGETNRTLSLINVQDIGTKFYECNVSNAGGLVTTVTNALHGRLIVLADTNKPTVAFTYPLANVRFTNGASYTYGGVARIAPTSVISGTAGDGGLITNVTVTRIFPAYPLLEMHPTLYGLPGAKKWTNEVTLVGGTNIWQAVVQDSAGNSNSVVITHSCFFAASATLTIATNGAGTLTPIGTTNSFVAFGYPTNGALLEAGRQYTILATPAANNIFTNWTVSDDLTTNCFSTNKLTFTMVTNLVITGNFVTNPIVAAGVAGKYNGLFYETNGVGEPDIKTNSTGFLGNLIVGTNRTYSGSLTLEGKGYAISGTFDLSGDATKIVSRSVYFRSNLFVALHLDWALGTKTVTGMITNMSNIGGEQWAAALLADLAGTAPTLGGSSRYTMLIAPESDSPTNSPGGYGYGLVTNNTFGLITLSGKLSDGTAISQSVPKSKDGYWPLFVSLYGGRELLAGWQTFASGAPTGTLGWVKGTMNSSSLIKSYLVGFTNASVDVTGSTYVKPALNTAALANTNLVLEIYSLDTNDVMDVKWDVQLKPNNTFVVKPGSSGHSSATNLLSGSIAIADGTLTFSFRPTGSIVNRTIVGAVNQSQTNGFGANIGRSRLNPGVTNVSSFYLHTP